MLLASFATLYAVGIALTIWSSLVARAFLARHESIADGVVLEEFKRLVRRDMYLALVQMGILGVGLVLGILLMRSSEANIIVVADANAALLVPSLIGRSLNNRLRSLSAATDELAAEHRNISVTWKKRPLPNF